MKNARWLCLTAAVLATALAGCRGTLGQAKDCPGDPDVSILELRNAWHRAPYHGLHESNAGCGGRGSEVRSKELLRRQAENLLYTYPRHVPTRLFAALLSYEANDPPRATEHLDTLFALQPIHPEAAILRGRIALEAGNLPYALSFLRDQVALSPDHAELYETLASAYYMNEQSEEAMAALAAAERLGSPRYRTLYNRGLVEEGRGDFNQAIAYYRESTTLQPHWPAPQARLDGLEKGNMGDPNLGRGFPEANER